MNKFTTVAALTVLCSVLAACGGQSGPVPQTQTTTQSQTQSQSFVQSVPRRSPAEINRWRPIFLRPKPEIDASTIGTSRFAATTIPFFSNSIKSPVDGITYTYTIAGADPHTSNVTTNITYVPIVVRFHFSDGTVLDPTKSGCGDTVPVESRFVNGPNFASVPLTSNGINVGTTQITDGFQRAEFWSLVKNKAYHTMLVASGSPIVINRSAPPGSITVAGVCSGKAHRIGEIDFSAFDQLIRSVVSSHSTPGQVPLIITYNIFETNGQCCIVGYHNAFARSTGTQLYAVAAYNDPGVFNVPIEDVHAWTHEIGELFNDPFLSNATPAYGPIGQIAGCQADLESGDPLTGTAFTVSLNGFTYHPQELAFFDWFYRTPAEGTGAEYSFEGTFEKPQSTVCM